MKSRSWLRGSVPACGIISALACGLAAAQAPVKVPALTVADPADAPQWESLAKTAGWQVIVPAAADNPDARTQAMAEAVRKAVAAGTVDPARVYLVGRGSASPMVFYAISRVPDLWAAGVAVEGTPQSAIDTDRIFAANFQHAPVLWVSAGAEDQALAARLKESGMNLEWRAAGASVAGTSLIEWLGTHQREEFPTEIDCETNSPTFSGCFWIQLTKFDATERNDVLTSSRLAGAARPSLDLGGFGFRVADPGPGVLVSMLPPKYGGPLRMGDRIVALDGRPLADARQYLAAMAKYTEEKPAVATVERGKERVRLETRVIVPRREVIVTARVQAQYLPEEKQVQIVTRTVTEMKVMVPPAWAEGGKLFWNGLALEKIDGPGCFVLSIDRELLHAARCR